MTSSSALGDLRAAYARVSGGLLELRWRWNSWQALVVAILVVLALRYAFTPPHTVLLNTSEVRHLPGPKLPWYGWLLGNMVDLAEARDTLIHPTWLRWGWTGRYWSLFKQERIYTFDPAAVAFIFAHPNVFERSDDLRAILSHVMGPESMVVIEGEKHKRQRRIINPAFSAGAVREMMPDMYDKAGELAVLLDRLVDDDSLAEYASRVPPAPEDRVPGARKIDMFKLVGNLTTDVIGLTAFEHDFNSLVPEDDSPDLLANRFNRLVDAANKMALLTEAQSILPVLDKIPTYNRKEIHKGRAEMERLADYFIEKRKQTLELDGGDSKDLLSLLARARLAPSKSDYAMTQDEMRHQMCTLLFAGSTTTAAAMSAILHELALHPDYQRRLREELLAVGEDRPSLDTLNTLPLLDAVIREILRLHPPASCTGRASTQDVVIPLSKPIPLTDGRMIDALPVKAGSYFMLSMARLNLLKEVWGDDADVFNPDRHLDPSLPKIPVPGIWGNVSSFITGPHACLGYRLAVAEMKTVLFTILRAFEFDELPSKPQIVYWTSLATQPQVKDEPGGQVPLLVRKFRTVD